eukprot:6272385-Prymnesium_polylepis.2
MCIRDSLYTGLIGAAADATGEGALTVAVIDDLLRNDFDLPGGAVSLFGDEKRTPRDSKMALLELQNHMKQFPIAPPAAEEGAASKKGKGGRAR